MAKFYGIGVGPGDPDLLTIKAAKILKEIDLIYTPITKKGRRSVALEIAGKYISEDARIEKRLFPLTRDLDINEPAWKEIASHIQEELDQGNDVAFITLGDPSTYSTFSYIVKYMEDGYDIETIAGVTSYNHISAIFNRALALDDEAFTIVPATADESVIRTAFENFDTVIILKIANHLKKVLPLLEEYQIVDKARVVIQASREGEKVIEDVSQLGVDSKIPYFSTMIVYLSEWWEFNEG